MPERTEKSHPKRVAQLSQQFVRLPYSAIVMAHAQGLPNTWAVFLMLLSYIDREDEEGNIYAHCSRSAICDALELDPKQVSNVVSYLTRKELLSVVKRGHNGRATVYKFNVGTYSESVPTGVGTYSESVPTRAKAAISPAPDSKVLTQNQYLQRVGTYSEPVPEELLQNSSSKNSSLDSEDSQQVGQFPYGIDPSTLPEKRFLEPLSAEELASLKRSNGEAS